MNNDGTVKVDGTDLLKLADGLAKRVVLLNDTIQGLECDLESAVDIAWKYGARGWVKANYPDRAIVLDRNTQS